MADIKKIKLTDGASYNLVDSSAVHSTDLATSTSAGIVKIGSGITVAADGTISVNITYPVTSVNNKTGAVTLSASDVSAVATTGNETIAGVKTFSSSPIVPTPTTDYQSATKKYVDDAISSSSGGTEIIVSATQPTGQKAGDFWFQIVD